MNVNLTVESDFPKRPAFQKREIPAGLRSERNLWEAIHFSIVAGAFGSGGRKVFGRRGLGACIAHGPMPGRLR
jgi:hypothetical protein